MGIFLFVRKFLRQNQTALTPKYIRLSAGVLFISFLIFFEFILVLLDPFLEDLTAGAPAYKLLANTLLAVAIFPLHHFLEDKLKEGIFKTYV